MESILLNAVLTKVEKLAREANVHLITQERPWYLENTNVQYRVQKRSWLVPAQRMRSNPE
jgi:hypothetical protein